MRMVKPAEVEFLEVYNPASPAETFLFHEREDLELILLNEGGEPLEVNIIYKDGRHAAFNGMPYRVLFKTAQKRWSTYLANLP